MAGILKKLEWEIKGKKLHLPCAMVLSVSCKKSARRLGVAKKLMNKIHAETDKKVFYQLIEKFWIFLRKWMFTWSHQWLSKERLSFTENAATKKKKDQSLRIPPWKIWIMSKNLYIPGFWICTNLFFTENINSTFINHIV